MEQAAFGAGCFWGVEETFRHVEGVESTQVGYMGGDLSDPSYEAVCTGRTGHAEVIYVEFDPQGVSYEKLLKVFWECHDPTTLNRQGPDVGTQYRSAVFCYTEAQKTFASATKEKIETAGVFRNPIVTEITDAGTFYPAEDYHQRYLEKRGVNECHAVPKVNLPI